MSYLDLPRLHFAGLFQADTSTVNNTPANFDTSAFMAENLEPVHGKGGWNPLGTGAFRLKQGAVTSVVYRDGTRSVSGADDPLVGCAVRDNDLRVAAKIVDLHPLEQSVPQVWGMRLTLGSAEHELVECTLVPPAAGDIWYRAHPRGEGDPWLSAAFQSVLNVVRWGDQGTSRFLRELREASPAELSIKFNLDGFDNDPASPGFSHGRLVGTIGPAVADEPRYFVRGRQLKRTTSKGDLYGSPADAPMFSAPAQVDERRRKVVVDLGNSLATTAPGGPFLPAFAGIELAVLPAGSAALPLGPLDCTAQDVYAHTAGVFEAPTGRALTDEELAALAGAPLAVVRAQGDGTRASLLQEAEDGIDVRPDQRVFRLDPGDTVRAEFHATRFGVPVSGLRLDLDLSSFGTSPDSTRGLTCSASAVTDARGRAPVRLEASDPGNPNGAVDGQVYFVEWASDPDPLLVNCLCVRVYDEFTASDDPSWENIRDVMQQYANLYPVMKRIVDLGDEQNVLRHRELLLFALSLPVEDPNHMPVTRDLSKKKRAAILNWLTATRPTPRVPVTRRDTT